MRLILCGYPPLVKHRQGYTAVCNAALCMTWFLSGIAIRAQCSDIRVTIAQGPQHAGGIGAQFWRRIADGTRRLTKFDREPCHLDSPVPRVWDRKDHFL